MLFERASELPQATVVVEPRSFVEYLGAGIELWLRERWQWLRPRTIPVLVALAGLGATVGSVNHLKPSPQIAKRQMVLDSDGADAYQPGRIRIVLRQ